MRSIIFKPDCERDVCATNLKLQSIFRNFESPFVLNSSHILEISYKIRNLGEAAYGTVLEVAFSQNVSFLKKMDFCEETPEGLSCMINYGQAVRQGSDVFVNFTLDGHRLTGKQLTIQGRLFSDGNETVSADNEILDVIQLRSLSNLVAVGSYYPSHINLHVQNSNVTIQTKLDVYNFGPSDMTKPYVHLFVPVGFIIGKTNVTFIRWNEENLKITHKGTVLKSTERILTNRPKTNASILLIEKLSAQDQFLLNKKGTTIVCDNSTVICKSVSFKLDSIVTNSEPIRVELSMGISLHSIRRHMDDDVEKLSLYITFGFDGSTEEIQLTTAGSLVLYRNIAAVPLWIYIASGLFGIVVLSVITYVLHKHQFFKRMVPPDEETDKPSMDGFSNVAFTEGSIMMIATSST
ncbi:uncharacterized protein LOC131437936 [Malaya genurostris]|uniref:uncharacterized protein LOC131437936 n=1 Tax=Malaya genurostris TaxID=325434 RepID=UPI0026F39A0F|nr:uncharacterized protein LOC131437936 [Malaya genurostris]